MAVLHLICLIIEFFKGYNVLNLLRWDVLSPAEIRTKIYVEGSKQEQEQSWLRIAYIEYEGFGQCR